MYFQDQILLEYAGIPLSGSGVAELKTKYGVDVFIFEIVRKLASTSLRPISDRLGERRPPISDVIAHRISQTTARLYTAFGSRDRVGNSIKKIAEKDRQYNGGVNFAGFSNDARDVTHRRVPITVAKRPHSGIAASLHSALYSDQSTTFQPRLNKYLARIDSSRG